MAKSLEFKLRTISRVLEQGEKISIVAFSEGCDRKSICKWVKAYQDNGLEGLQPKLTQRCHSSQYKTLALAYLHEEGVTIGMASRKFGISRQTLQTWRKESKGNLEKTTLR